MELKMKTELGCLALVGFLYLIISGIARLSSLIHSGPKSLLESPVIHHTWAQRLHDQKMMLMNMVMLFLIPINICGMLEMRDYHFLYKLTTVISITFCTVFYIYCLSLLGNYKYLDQISKRVISIILWFLYFLIGYVYLLG